MVHIVTKSKLMMDTVVEIKVVTSLSLPEVEPVIAQAFEAFRNVEQACSRFTPDSELMRACQQIGTHVQISSWLFQPLKFAMEMAEWTQGIFDPTIGKTMETYGFNRHYLTGETLSNLAEDNASYRDIVLSDDDRTMYLHKPLVIDLGAVAKGFAIDLASRMLANFHGFVINAGGDLYAGGLDETGHAWRIGIQHPAHKNQIIDAVEISNEAVCTSGGYERKSKVREDIHHIINPNSKQSPHELSSCSIVAPYAMMADVFSTVVCLYGLDQGKRLLNEMQLKGILVTSKYHVERVGGI
ncbi:FAD:protein FMN transferase [Paenibacillus sp. Soil787]|uniref:FAD:protein FMN transferase n=1 Tax=Paenibacillus sp. Soil787 TaxID=1736411 RepID=UPI0007030E2C|nr:FAD:protein FMN transferase [Paenibacillus sp. Soil787]KRF18489.1 thiamine biosynthesis protein ApbE [Paenibacillus sp. Soil787]